MSNFLLKQLPALYYVMPLITSLLIVIFRNLKFARAAFVTSTAISLFLSISGLLNYRAIVRYVFGDFNKNIGIEFIYDNSAAVSLVFLSAIFWFFSFFASNAIQSKIEVNLSNKRQNLLYSLFLFLQAALGGLILTNDLFNIFVLIEISSLSTYALLAISSNKKSIIGAFEYLLLGTLGATIILLGIGLILSITGSLNISIINDIFLNNYQIVTKFKNILSISIILIIFGCLIKIGLFPLYYWQVRAYIFSSPVMASILMCSSSFIYTNLVIKIICRFNNFDFRDFNYYIAIIFPALANVLIGTFLAYKSKLLRNIIIYSSLSSAGYCLLLWPFTDPTSFGLVQTMVMYDSTVKLGLMFFIVALGYEEIDLPVAVLKGLVKKNRIIGIAYILLLMHSASMPLTLGFINKLNLMQFILYQYQYLILLVILLCSMASIIYHFNLVILCLRDPDDVSLKIDTKAAVGFILIVAILCFFIFYYSDLLVVWQNIFSEYDDVSY